jgi:S-adenosylmethionine:tRNA ribosyltransferase-isomerase
MFPELPLSEFQYDLPEERIARYPLGTRDQSKLLVWQGGEIQDSAFSQLADYLPVNTALFFNDTKVIPARILFEKPTGGIVEVFLLGPSDNSILMGQALQQEKSTTWVCTVGNAKRWPESMVLMRTFGEIELRATWADRQKNWVTLSWSPPNLAFAMVIEKAGTVPLPPYLNREAEGVDKERYQTIYSLHPGAVAAPTAGLHFTPQVLDRLKVRGVTTNHLTLHVSAGTFVPIKDADVTQHRMHMEEVVVTRDTLLNLLSGDRSIVAVGTTALRTLESLYWFGVKLLHDKHALFEIPQELPYETTGDISAEEALRRVLEQLENQNISELAGHTSLYIVPGYRFRVVQGLITNFHQPGSSLLVLISAFLGPSWKKVYRHALERNYRFLSYGDSSLLLP